MSTTTDYTINLTLGYEGTEFERTLALKNVDSVSAATETVRSNVKAVNASLEGGTDGGLSNFFRSDDYDASNSIGALNAIKQAVIKRADVTVLI